MLALHQGGVLLINADEEGSLESTKKIISFKGSNDDTFRGPDMGEDKDIIEERERVYAGKILFIFIYLCENKFKLVLFLLFT